MYLPGTARVNNVGERTGPFRPGLTGSWLGEGRSRTHNIKHATQLFIMNINSNHEWGEYMEQLILQVVMLPGLQGNFDFSWSVRPPTPVMGMASGWRKEKQ